MKWRIFWNIGMVILSIVAPWWVTLLGGAVGAWIFSWYLELIIIGVLYDAVFGLGVSPWYHMIMHTLIFTIPVLVLEFIKKNSNMRP